MYDILVPIFCGAILPMVIVFIVSMRNKNSDNKRAEIMIKAIESGEEIDMDKLAEALGKPKRTPLEVLNGRLLRGCMFSLVGAALVILYFIWPEADSASRISVLFLGAISAAVGIAYLIVYFVTRGQISDEKKS